MRSTQYPEDVILCLLKEAATGTPIEHVCRSARISMRTFYRWRARYGGLTSSAARERTDLVHENIRLRSLVEELLRERRDMPAAEREEAAALDLITRPLPPAAREAQSSGRFAAVRGRR